nr:hypothetical protein CFP56_11675 [Quercus suber]
MQILGYFSTIFYCDDRRSRSLCTVACPGKTQKIHASLQRAIGCHIRGNSSLHTFGSFILVAIYNQILGYHDVGTVHLTNDVAASHANKNAMCALAFPKSVLIGRWRNSTGVRLRFSRGDDV